MAIGSQCGEDAVFEEFFGAQEEGFVVDVGAADGQDNSNSWKLIQKGWGGILLEPDPEQYKELDARYSSTPRVITMSIAAGTETGLKPFYSCRQVLTFSTDWRDRCVEAYDVSYTESMITVLRLQFILESLNCPKEIDLLSIDCEALDVDVLNSLDLSIYSPRLICMECGTDIPGYELYHKTCGNSIYRRL